MLLLKATGNNGALPLPSFLKFPANLGIPWLAAASLQTLSPPPHGFLPHLSVSVQTSLSLKGYIIGFKVNSNQSVTHLNLITSAKIPFLHKVTVTGTGGRDFNIPFWKETV